VTLSYSSAHREHAEGVTLDAPESKVVLRKRVVNTSSLRALAGLANPIQDAASRASSQAPPSSLARPKSDRTPTLIGEAAATLSAVSPAPAPPSPSSLTAPGEEALEDLLSESLWEETFAVSSRDLLPSLPELGDAPAPIEVDLAPQSLLVATPSGILHLENVISPELRAHARAALEQHTSEPARVYPITRTADPFAQTLMEAHTPALDAPQESPAPGMTQRQGLAQAIVLATRVPKLEPPRAGKPRTKVADIAVVALFVSGVSLGAGIAMHVDRSHIAAQGTPPRAAVAGPTEASPTAPPLVASATDTSPKAHALAPSDMTKAPEARPQKPEPKAEVKPERRPERIESRVAAAPKPPPQQPRVTAKTPEDPKPAPKAAAKAKSALADATRLSQLAKQQLDHEL
jgi:hypothetical protein